MVDFADRRQEGKAMGLGIEMKSGDFSTTPRAVVGSSTVSGSVSSLMDEPELIVHVIEAHG